VIVGEEERLYSDALVVEDVNWLSIPKPEEEIEVKVKIRYRHDGEEGVLMPIGYGKVRIEFKRPVKSITPGQAAVFYDGDIVLGGGWIKGSVSPDM
jgi:tRNA-specific 2-thiouridylase